MGQRKFGAGLLLSPQCQMSTSQSYRAAGVSGRRKLGAGLMTVTSSRDIMAEKQLFRNQMEVCVIFGYFFFKSTLSIDRLTNRIRKFNRNGLRIT